MIVSITGTAIGFEVTDFGVIREPESVFFRFIDSGFSYGDIPAVVTPLPCSDYPGNLSALFSDIPAASESASLGIFMCIEFVVLATTCKMYVIQKRCL